MICKKCGASYEGNYCPNGCDSPELNKKAKKPFYKKWWFWVIIVFVGLIVLSSGNKDDNTADDTIVTTAASDVSSASEQTTQNTEAEETTVPADPYYHVGDVINANGLEITYVAAEKWEESNPYMQPDDGYMYIRLLLSAENTSSTDRYISYFEFTCYADGKKEESHYSSNEPLEGGTLSSGRKDEGYIYFMVPVDAEQIEVEYETSFWTDQKAILKVELA